MFCLYSGFFRRLEKSGWSVLERIVLERSGWPVVDNHFSPTTCRSLNTGETWGQGVKLTEQVCDSTCLLTLHILHEFAWVFMSLHDFAWRRMTLHDVTRPTLHDFTWCCMTLNECTTDALASVIYIQIVATNKRGLSRITSHCYTWTQHRDPTGGCVIVGLSNRLITEWSYWRFHDPVIK